MGTAITIANEKGGVGKSTTTISISHGLALQGKKVLILDLDPQGNCATLLGMDPEPGAAHLLASELIKPEQVIRSTGRDGLDIIPGNRETSYTQTYLASRKVDYGYLRNILKPAAKQYDFILIDTAPSVGELMGLAIYAADYVIIPTAADFLSTEGTNKIFETMTNISSGAGWKGSLIGVLPTFYDEFTKESKTILEDLQKRYGEGVLMPIHRATILRECAAYGKTIFEADKASRSAHEYSKVIDKILEVAK